MEIGRLLGGYHVECDKCHLENDPLLNREPVKLFEQGPRAKQLGARLAQHHSACTVVVEI